MERSAGGQDTRGSAARRKLAALCAAVIVAAGALVWAHLRAPVASGELAAFLDAAAGSGKVRFSDVDAAVTRRGNGEVEMKVDATARAAMPLYSSAGDSDYVRGILGSPPPGLDAARQAVSAGTADSEAADPWSAPLLRQTVAAGAPFAFQGFVLARRESGHWQLSFLSGGFPGGGPQGNTIESFGTGALVEGQPATEARLHDELTGLQAFSRRLSASGARAGEEHADEAAARRRAFLGMIACGRFLEGTAIEEGGFRAIPLYLEFIADPDAGVTRALLRNDGGWLDARAFQGSWTADDAFSAPVLSLDSQPEQAIRGGGSIVETTQPWSIELSPDGRGGLSGKTGSYTYTFRPLDARRASAVETRLEAELNAASAATAGGSVYIGTATSGDGRAETLLLRFSAQQGLDVSATLESTSQPWRRQMSGTLMANARRSGGRPIRLSSAADAAAHDAPAQSALGDADDVDLALGVADGGLSGEDGRLTYHFSPLTETDTSRLQAERADRARNFLRVVRPGIVFDGFLREDQGFVGHAQIEIGELNVGKGTITATLRSLSRPGAFQRFSGTVDPAVSAIVLNSTGHGNFPADDAFDIPFLKSPAPASLHLEVTGSWIAGTVEGDPHWKVEFPLGAFLAAPTEPRGADAAGFASVFPAFPQKAGAYVLVGHSWSMLPENGGKVVVETIRPDSDMNLPVSLTAAIQTVANAIDREQKKEKVPYLEFDGKDPRPEANGAAMVLLYVGPRPQGEPPVELAQAELTKSGQRRLRVRNGPEARIEFGDDRLPVYLRSAGDGRILVTTTAMASPGPYVFIAGAGYELTQR